MQVEPPAVQSARAASWRFLVTAGNTREPIDAVRDWGNVFSGNTGLAIAQALSVAGHVDLLTSNRAHLSALGTGPGAPAISGSGFTSHAELRKLLTGLMGQNVYDAVFMTAAVADYHPAGAYEVVARSHSEAGETWVVRSIQAGKVKGSYSTVAFLGRPTEKLVDLFRSEWGHRGLLVKFKLEVGASPEELLRIGQASRLRSRADYLVANTLEMVQGRQEGQGGAYLLSNAGHEWVPRAALGQRMLDLVRTSLS